MKEIRYICTKGPVRLIGDFGEKLIDIDTDTIVTQTSYGAFLIPNQNRTVHIGNQTLNKYFKRYYTENELQYIRDVREKAAIAAIQRLIYKKDNIRGYIIEVNPRHVAEKSVEYANALVNELIKENE